MHSSLRKGLLQDFDTKSSNKRHAFILALKKGMKRNRILLEHKTGDRVRQCRIMQDLESP